MCVAAVILAAGQSSRMGANKLILEIDGKPMVRHVAEAAVASRARPVMAVVGHEAATVMGVLDGLDITFVENPHFREGMSSSLRAGVATLPQSVSGALILLGDMPEIAPSLIDDMIAATDERAICVATHKGRRGHPVLFGRHYFPDLLKLDGDVGARNIMARHAACVVEIAADNAAPLLDIDTPDALTAFRARRS